MAMVAAMARCMAINQQLSTYGSLNELIMTVADLKLLKVRVCVVPRQ